MKGFFKSIKNILSMVFVIVMIVVAVLTSQNSYSTPEKVARNYMNSFLKGNYKKAYALSTAKNNMTVDEYVEEAQLEYSLLTGLGVSVSDAGLYISDAVISEDEQRATVYCTLYFETEGMESESLSLVLEDGRWLVEE